MVVFKYFYEKMGLFGPLMNKWEEKERTQQEVVNNEETEPVDEVNIEDQLKDI